MTLYGRNCLLDNFISRENLKYRGLLCIKDPEPVDRGPLYPPLLEHKYKYL